MKRTQLLACSGFTTALLLGFHACALTYEHITPAQITEYTDVWVHGRVLSVTGPETRKNEFGDTFRNIELRLEILGASRKDLTPIALIRSETSMHGWLQTGLEVFAALTVDNGQLEPFGMLGLYGWDTVALDTECVGTPFGPAPKDLYWRWVRDLRTTIDTGGDAPDASIEFWRKALEEGALVEVGLAGDFFQLVRTIPIEAEAFIEAYERLLRQVEAKGAWGGEEDYDMPRWFSALAISLGRTLRCLPPNAGGEQLLDLIQRDLKAPYKPNESEVRKALLAVVQRFDDPDLLARVPEVYGALKLDHTTFKALPIVPSEAIDTWLWSMLQNPDDPASHAASIWRAMALRGDEQLTEYLERFLSGEFTLPGDTERLVGAAKEAIEIYESKHVPREERLTRWATRISNGDKRPLTRLYREVTPEDRDLIPILSPLRSEQWLAENFVPPHYPAAMIIQAIPDPAFAPALLELAKEATGGELLRALVRCGEGKTAIELAIAELGRPLLPGKGDEIYQAMTRKAEAILVLGEQREPELSKEFLPYLQHDTLDAFARQLISAGMDPPFPVRQLRDNALLALARCGHPEAVRRLEAAYADEDIRGRLVAAFALYAIGNDTGAPLIDAYCNRTAEALPEIQARWGEDLAGWSVFSNALSYLESPRLDHLYLDRIDRGFSSDDTLPCYDAGFVWRTRPRLLRALSAALSRTESHDRKYVIDCLRTITGENFGYDENDSPILRAKVIAKWQTYLGTPAP